MALTETQIVSNELEKVRSKVELLYERDDTFFSTIEKAADVEVVSSRDMRIPLELRPGGNFGHYNPDGGDLGRGDGPGFDKAVISSSHFKFGVEYTHKAKVSTDDSRKAVLNTVKHLLAKSMAEFRRQCDSICMQAGDGVVGTISAVSNSGGKDTYTLGTDGFGARLVRYGQWLAVYTSTLSASRTITPASGSLDGIAGQVDFHDGPNKQIRLNGQAASVVAGDKLVLNGLSGANPVSLYGVPYHQNAASTGSWLGFTRSATPEVRCNQVAAGGAFALSHARIAVNKIGDRLGVDQIGKLDAWMHPCQTQAYEELGQLVQVINKDASDSGLNMYFGGNMQMAGASVRKHYSWDKTRIDFINPKTWGRAELQPAGFYEVDGKKLFELRGSSGGVAAASIFYITNSWNLFSKNPAAGSYISGLTVPSGY